MAEFENDSVVRCQAIFENPTSGAFVDPDGVSVEIRTPGGVTTTYVYGTNPEIQQASTGHYYVEVTAVELGTWIYRFESTGTYSGANQSTFYIY